MTSVAPSGKRLIRSKSGLRIIPLNECDRSPFELVEPAWIPDDESPACMECRVKFDFIKRRHHCRRCGRVCCAGCCRARLALPRMCFLDPVRLCSPCATTTASENTFYHCHLKTLLEGAILIATGGGCGCGSNLTSCRLSLDQRMLQVTGVDILRNFFIHRLTAVHATKGRSGSESEEAVESSGAEEAPSSGPFYEASGDGACTCVVLTFRVVSEFGGGEAGELGETELCLSAPDDAAPSAYLFLRALEKAALMAMEARPIIGTGN